MKTAPKHDFSRKLQQESVLPMVMEYVKWRKLVDASLASGTTPPPMPGSIGLVSINLDLTTACNYHCPHCIDWEILNSPQKYAYDNLLASLTELIKNGLRSVILIGGGEPTLHPKFVDVVHFLKENGVQVAVVSNGSNNAKIKEIAPMLSQRDWVRFSLDSGTDDTFQKMHQPKRPVRLEEICAWVPKIHEANPNLSVGFSFIIVWDHAEREPGAEVISNIDEMVTASRLARDNGFKYISFKPFLTRHPNGAEVMDPNVMADFNRTLERISQAVLEAKKLETDNFKVIESTNLRVLMEGNWRDFTRQPKTCHMTAFRQVVSPLGVYHCPGHRGVPKARIGDATMFSDRAKRPESQELITGMIEGFDASVECASITCLYNEANWWLEGLIKNSDSPDPTSVPDGDFFL